MASNKSLKLGVQFHFICRYTALTSIQSNNYLPNSRPCCGRSLHTLSRNPPSLSTACARPSPLACTKSLGLSAQHSSPTQDMVNLTGKRSNSARDIVWARVMPFNQVAVVGVHDPHEVGEIGGRARMERGAQRRGPCRQIGNHVG